MPSLARTVRCATGTGTRPSTAANRNPRAMSASNNGPSTIANPAPVQTLGPAENGR